jgi:hypothetical protein
MTHTTSTPTTPTAETPWPIDVVGQKVLIEATVYDEPDPEDDDPDTRYYTLDINTGNPHVKGHDFLGIREDHVRKTVRRIPDPPTEPTMVPAKLLTGMQVQVFGEWRDVIGVDGPIPGGHIIIDAVRVAAAGRRLRPAVAV